jgi:7,8-dihydro-6-hydroxymethylpterin-pyrophosphokinase
MSDEVQATYPWQEIYFNAILETDSNLVTNRIFEALSAIEQRWLSPVTDEAEYRALVAAHTGIKGFIAERTEG